jgi:hypothetical protein
MVSGAPDRRATLAAALGFLTLEPRAPELQLLHRWADTERGSATSSWEWSARATGCTSPTSRPDLARDVLA